MPDYIAVVGEPIDLASIGRYVHEMWHSRLPLLVSCECQQNLSLSLWAASVPALLMFASRFFKSRSCNLSESVPSRIPLCFSARRSCFFSGECHRDPVTR